MGSRVPDIRKWTYLLLSFLFFFFFRFGGTSQLRILLKHFKNGSILGRLSVNFLKISYVRLIYKLKQLLPALSLLQDLQKNKIKSKIRFTSKVKWNSKCERIMKSKSMQENIRITISSLYLCFVCGSPSSFIKK